MGKFRQISTELWPLINVKKFGAGLFLAFIDRFSSNFFRTLYQEGVVWD